MPYEEKVPRTYFITKKKIADILALSVLTRHLEIQDLSIVPFMIFMPKKSQNITKYS